MFMGNHDSNTIQLNRIILPAKALSVMLKPISWKKNFAVRMELYGCHSGETTFCLCICCFHKIACTQLKRFKVFMRFKFSMPNTRFCVNADQASNSTENVVIHRVPQKYRYAALCLDKYLLTHCYVYYKIEYL